MNQLLIVILFGIVLQRALVAAGNYVRLSSAKSFRRLKEESVPQLGGLGIYLTLLFGAIYNSDQHLLEFLLISAPLVVGGVIDDIFEISARGKLLFQFFSAGLLVAFKYEVLIWQQWAPDSLFVPLLTVFFVITLCNAINFIDGLDGIVASYMLAVVPAIYLISNELQSSSSILLGAIVAFLYYNKRPAKIYLGDVGSNLMGFTLAYFFLTHQPKSDWHFTILGFLMMFSIPLVDILSATIRRVLQGQSPFNADKDHIHHRLLKVGLHDTQISLIFFTIGVLSCNVGYLLLQDLGPLVKTSTLASSIGVLTIILYLVHRTEGQLGQHVSQFGRTLLETYINLRGNVADIVAKEDTSAMVIDLFSYYKELQRLGLPKVISYVKDVSGYLENSFPNAGIYLASSYSLTVIRNGKSTWSSEEKKKIENLFLQLCERHKVPRLIGENPEGLYFYDNGELKFLFNQLSKFKGASQTQVIDPPRAA